MERWECGFESDRFSTEPTVGGLNGDVWPVSPWPVPRAERQEVASRVLGGHKPSSVCLYQTAIRYLIQTDQQAQAPLTGSSEGYVRALQRCIIIIQLP